MEPRGWEPAVVVETDAEGRVVELNDAARHVLSELALEASDIRKILPPNFAELVVRSQASQNEIVTGEATFNSRRWAWVFVPKADGAGARAFGIDLARWEVGAKGPSPEREHLLSILSSMGDGVDIINGDHVIEFQNDVLNKRFGDRRGEKCYAVYYGRNEPCEDCSVTRAIETDEVQRVEKPGVDGRTYDVTSSPFLDVDGKVKVIEVGRDVTARKEAQQALSESEQRFRSIVESSRDVFYIHDTNGVFQYMSPNVKEAFGFDIPVGGDPWTTLLTDNPVNQRGIELTQRAIETGEKQPRYELEQRHPEGGTTWVEISETPLIRDGKVVGIIGAARDVTERKRAEAALRESEERFRALAEQSPVAICVIQDGRLAYMNPACSEMLGYTIDEMLAMDPANMVHPDDRELVRQRMVRRLSGETVEPSRYEVRAVTKSGETRWFDVVAVAFAYRGHRATMAQAIDITPRRLAEASLRESEERFRALSERSPIAIIVAQDGLLVYVNPTAAKYTGYDAGELLGKSPAFLAHPDDREMVLDRMRRRLAGEEVEPSHYEIRVITQSGKTRWIDLSTVAFEYRGRRATMAHCVDVTDRKHAEIALRQAEARYRGLYENATDIIYSHDLDWKITSVNAAAERVFGWPRDKMTDKTLRDWFHPDSWPVVCRKLEEKLLHPDRPSKPYEVRMYDTRGEAHWLEISSRLVFDESGPVGVTGIARDITERKRLEAQLRQAQKMEALGQLAGGVAHDFNNLLTGILGYTRLQAERSADDEKGRENLGQIERAAERAAALTRQMLAFSRRQPLTSIHLDLNRVIVDFIKLLARTVGEHIEVHVDLGPDLAAIYADPGQIEQVLLNLAVNARDAMSEGGQISIRTRMVDFDAPFVATHPWARRGRFVCLSVADNGAGMSSDVRDRVFEPFFSTKSPGKGTGLGLSIVYGIIKQHDGLIDLQSEPRHGTTFHLYFPAAERHARTVVADRRTTPVPFGHERILLAEDEPIVRELATEVLVDSGYHVVSVGDGEEALKVLRERPADFDLLILDVVMPRKGGVEVWNEVRTIAPHLKGLLTSGYAPEPIEPRTGEAVVPPFLAKPFAPDELLQKVREALQSHPSPKDGDARESPGG